MAPKNGIPRTDGEITLYTPDPAHKKELDRLPAGILPKYNKKYKVYYVNGMATKSRAHMQGARKLASIIDGPVHGIYNQTGLDGTVNFGDGVRGKLWDVGSGLIDFGQCTLDQLLIIGRKGSLLGRLFGRIAPEQIRKKAANVLLRYNLAAVALYDELYKNIKKNIIIVCHSQGNLITSNATGLLRWSRGKKTMGNIRVFGLASPAVSWAPNGQQGFRYSLYRDPRDPVTLLSLPGIATKHKNDRSQPLSEDAFSLFGQSFEAHDLERYLVSRNFLRDIKQYLKR